MSFKVKIQNIGKLTDAEINIGDFTVLAGPNNTGKSFVSKLLYSLFDGMNANHALVHFNSLVNPLRESLERIERLAYVEEDALLSLLQSEISKMEDVAKSFSIDNSEEIGKQVSEIFNSVTNMRRLYRKIRPDIRRRLTQEQDPIIPSRVIGRALKAVEEALSELYADIQEIQEGDADQFIVYGIREKILQNVIQNFQVPSLSSLRARPEIASEIFMDGIGKFEFDDGDIQFSIEAAGLQQLQDYSRVIYLESPVYWKLRFALERIRISPRFFHSRGRERLSGVPGYFYDLARALREEYSGKVAFPELYNRLTSKMGGKITISDTGELNFYENERSFSLHTTAMGVVNLGILTLLIERKIIDEGTFLFIDEPEAHLHPAWQVGMAEALFELARQGVNVVIATHSIDILKWLEVHVKKNPEDERLVALNQFHINNGGSDEDFEANHINNGGSDEDFRMKLARIKRQLTEPFSQLFVDGI